MDQSKEWGRFETGCELGDQLLAYWRSLPREGELGLPTRASLNPAGMKSLLKNVFLLEWRAHDHAVVRLRGTWLDDRLARPRENYNLFEQYSNGHRAAYENLLDALVQQPCGAGLLRRRVNEDGRAFCYCTSYLPLLDAEGFPRFFVGIGWLEPLEKSDGGPAASDDSLVQYEGASYLDLRYIDCGHGVPSETHF